MCVLVCTRQHREPGRWQCGTQARCRMDRWMRSWSRPMRGTDCRGRRASGRHGGVWESISHGPMTSSSLAWSSSCRRGNMERADEKCNLDQHVGSTSGKAASVTSPSRATTACRAVKQVSGRLVRGVGCEVLGVYRKAGGAGGGEVALRVLSGPFDTAVDGPLVMTTRPGV